MSNVIFNEDHEPPRMRDLEPKGLYKLVIGWGLAKNEQQASIVLVIVALLALLIAVIYPMLVL